MSSPWTEKVAHRAIFLWQTMLLASYTKQTLDLSSGGWFMNLNVKEASKIINDLYQSQDHSMLEREPTKNTPNKDEVNKTMTSADLRQRSMP